MKRYHECAVVKDGNKRVGFFVIDNGNIPLKNSVSIPWQYVDLDTFKKLVDLNLVQYLVLKNDSIVCEYTDEEICSLRKLGISLDIIKHTKESYFDMDVSFKHSHMQIAISNPNCIMSSVGEITSLFGQVFVNLFFVGNPVSLQKLCNEVCEYAPNLKNFIRNNETVVHFMCPIDITDSLCNIISVIPLFSTSTLKYYINSSLKTPKLPFIQRRVSSEVCQSLCNKFDKITERNLSSLNF